MHPITRRGFGKGLSLGAGGLLLSPLVSRLESEAAGLSQGQPRFVFLVEGNGLWPHHIQPEGIPLHRDRIDGKGQPTNAAPELEDISLSAGNHELPPSLQPLRKYRDRLTVIQGLSGRVCGGGHSNEYGGLGCYPRNGGPRAETIDSAISQSIPAIFRHLALGISRDMRSDIIYDCSAAGPNQKTPIYTNPALAYDMLFGKVLRGNPQGEALTQKHLLNFMVDDVKRLESHFAGPEREKLQQYWRAFESIAQRQSRLGDVDPKQIDPMTNLYQSAVESDRLDAHFQTVAMAFATGMTNVATLASGVGQHHFEITFKGLGINANKHHIGHLQVDGANEMAIKIRQFHTQLIARLMDQLAAIPEGEGAMLDNTLIVYLSENAGAHHSSCYEWPVVMLGNLGGRLAAGDRYLCFPQYGKPGHRTMANLYTTFLHAVGDQRERFGMKDPGLEGVLNQDGPLAELLA
ncbi:DUF1552 domain-containing protein [Lignipirellula cremea]|uniref:DUF1552 domain-containing protein n=1 Tax=Lignipirellula cremea TaxID=2528010 RepID=A0A518DLG4_9BACT|nr:DUF1552 domain-containing protein [Lignipirellula cremea]QDU92683.1 hypothetical protein Pla8534_04310 [Lignipirellula cremea]